MTPTGNELMTTPPSQRTTGRFVSADESRRWPETWEMWIRAVDYQHDRRAWAFLLPSQREADYMLAAIVQRYPHLCGWVRKLDGTDRLLR